LQLNSTLPYSQFHIVRHYFFLLHASLLPAQ
jgi:hypothetical protein